MNHQGTIPLETERLLLRRFTKEDLEQIYQNCWSDEVCGRRERCGRYVYRKLAGGV